ncbi:hypothetical protein ABE504_20625 [Paenibacillus oryzisoli]|uniref:hypothetical protein n=1 Tax=Paenibacillus oryzisoli TaxID=1850517 RepID=UPI003D28B323
MKKEVTVYFKIIHRDKTTLLRGILYLEEHQQPTLHDYQQCLEDCGHQVVLTDPEHIIFKASKPGEQYLIHIQDEKTDSLRDVVVEQLAKNLMRTDY